MLFWVPIVSTRNGAWEQIPWPRADALRRIPHLGRATVRPPAGYQFRPTEAGTARHRSLVGGVGGRRGDAGRLSNSGLQVRALTPARTVFEDVWTRWVKTNTAEDSYKGLKNGTDWSKFE